LEVAMAKQSPAQVLGLQELPALPEQLELPELD
jgi:hypothetical protein